MNAAMQTTEGRGTTATALTSDRPAAVDFPEGLVGLPEAKRFEFETSPEIEPLLRMRCLDRPELSFLVVDAKLVSGEYTPRFERKALEAIGLEQGHATLVLAMTHIAPRIEECTANLLAPLLINPLSMRGLQVVLDPAAYSTHHPLVPAAE